jgi:hypothetical protein
MTPVTLKRIKISQLLCDSFLAEQQEVRLTIRLELYNHVGASPTPSMNRVTATPLGVRLDIKGRKRGVTPLNAEANSVTSASR